MFPHLQKECDLALKTNVAAHRLDYDRPYNTDFMLQLADNSGVCAYSHHALVGATPRKASSVDISFFTSLIYWQKSRSSLH